MTGAMLSMAARTPPPSGGATVTLHPASIAANTPFDTARLEIRRTGVEHHHAPSGSGNVDYDWISPKTSTVGDGYDVRCTVTSGGPLTAGVINTWQQINTTRTWEVNPDSDGGPGATTILIEIRPTGGGATLASASYTLSNGA